MLRVRREVHGAAEHAEHAAVHAHALLEAVLRVEAFEVLPCEFPDRAEAELVEVARDLFPDPRDPAQLAPGG